MNQRRRGPRPNPGRRSVEEKKGFFKRFWFPLSLAVLALSVLLVTWALMERAKRDTVLDRLPRVPDLSTQTEKLRQELAKANQEIKRALNTGRQQVGQKIGALGNLYQANHYYDRALRCYGLAMEWEDQNPRWPYFLAFIRQERGESESVLNLLEKTLSLDPTYSPAVLQVADIHFKNGDMERAKAFYERRLEIQEGDPYALLGLARIALRHSQFETARSHLLEAIRLNPEFGNAYRLLASVYAHEGKEKERRDSLDRASRCTRFIPAFDSWIEELNERCYDVDQLLVLGSKAITALDIEKASSFFGRAKELAPGNPKTHLSLGRLCFMVGQRDEARGFFEEAIRLDPRSDEAYFQLGLILRGEGNLKKAKEMFLKALDFHPNNPNVHNNLGVILLEQQKFQEAAGSFYKALEIYPEHINARYNLGLALWGLGNRAAAMNEYRQVLSVKPDWAIPANSLAWILATDRDKGIRNGEEAVKWALVACEGKGRDNPEFLDTLAAAFARTGRFQQAEQTARESLKLARSAGDKDLAKEIEHRLMLYRSGKAFSE